jgi:uncharacterized RDD family membrane protein YckC
LPIADLPVPQPRAPRPAPIVLANTAPAGPVYASFGRRYAAATLDLLLVAVPLLVVGILLTSALGVTIDDQADRVWESILAAFCLITLFWIYNALLISGSYRSTWGMRALMLQTVDAHSLAQIDFTTATRRYFASLLSALVFFIGYLIQPFTKRRQALHDMMAGTVVLTTGKASVPLVAILTVLGIAVPAAGAAAVIALPAYQDYAVETEIAEAVKIADAAKTAVEAYYRANRAVPATLAAAGAPQPAANARYLLSLDPASGLIIVKFNLPPVSDKTIMYAPGLDQQGNLSLLCVNQGVPPKYLRGCNSNN